MKIQISIAFFLIIALQLPCLFANSQELVDTACGWEDDGPAAPSEKLKPWFADTKERLKSTFLREPHSSEIREVICAFKVSPDGVISDISYCCREKNKDHNEWASQIISASGPLKPLPKDVKWSQKVQVEFSDSKIGLWMMVKNGPVSSSR